MAKIEQIAMDYVMKYERQNGRSPRDVSKERKGFDIESNNRKIEVKGRGIKNPTFVRFNRYNFAAMQVALNEEKEFWLYIVYNIYKGNPKLIQLNKNDIIKRMKLRNYWDIPLRAADRE